VVAFDPPLTGGIWVPANTWEQAAARALKEFNNAAVPSHNMRTETRVSSFL